MALINTEVCSIVEPSLQVVFNQFFEIDSDPLSQMAIMDFITTLTQQPWTQMFIAKSNFLERLLHKYAHNQGDTYGFITNNLISLGAFVYSQNKEVFNALANQDYVAILKRLAASKAFQDLSTFCSCMFFIFQRKESLTEYFIHE